MDATVAYLPLPLNFSEAVNDRFNTPRAQTTSTNEVEKDDNSSESSKLPRLIYLSAMESRTTLQSLASTQSLNSNATSVFNFETPTTQTPKSGIVPDSEGANYADTIEGSDGGSGKKIGGKSAISSAKGMMPVKLDDSSSQLQSPSPTSPSKRVRSFSDTFTSLAFSSPERAKLQQQLGQQEKGKSTPVNELEKAEADITNESTMMQNPQTPPRKPGMVTIANSPEIVGAGITTTLPQDETVTTTDAPSSSVDASPMRKTIQSWSWTWGALPVKFRSSKSEPSLATKGATPGLIFLLHTHLKQS